MGKVSPYLISSFLCTLSYRYLPRPGALPFPNNTKGFKRTTTRFGHLSPQQKKAKRQKKETTL